MFGTKFNLPGNSWWAIVRLVGLITFVITLISVATTHVVMHFLVTHYEPVFLLAAFVMPILMGVPILLFFAVRQQTLKLANQTLQDMAYTDSMLGCLNRRAFTTTTDNILAKADRDFPCALLIVDADHFKRVNDKFGHAQGDVALKIIVQAINSAIRETDMAGRIGGEEFAILLPSADWQSAGEIAERVRDAVASAEFSPNYERYKLTVSIGVAHTEVPSDFSTLFEEADHGLFAAKHAGRNTINLERETDTREITARQA